MKFYWMNSFPCFVTCLSKSPIPNSLLFSLTQYAQPGYFGQISLAFSPWNHTTKYPLCMILEYKVVLNKLCEKVEPSIHFQTSDGHKNVQINISVHYKLKHIFDKTSTKVCMSHTTALFSKWVERESTGSVYRSNPPRCVGMSILRAGQCTWQDNRAAVFVAG